LNRVGTIASAKCVGLPQSQTERADERRRRNRDTLPRRETHADLLFNAI
jgi:hypothetical protein